MQTADLLVLPKGIRRATLGEVLGLTTGFNNQGSILPIPTDATIFAYNSGGATGGEMWVCVNTAAAYNLRRPDRSVLVAPASAAYDRPAAPTLQQIAGGGLGGRTYFVRVALAKRNPQNNATVFYRVSPESSTVFSVINLLLRVRSPAAVAGYDGYVVLVGTAANGEVVQEQLGGGAPATDDGIIPFGTDWTEPVGGAATSSTTNTPYAAVMDNGFTIGSREVSTTYQLYVYFDPTVGTGGVYRIASDATGAWPKVLDEGAAQEQNGDGHVAMSAGVTIAAATPIGGGTGSGSGSGRKLK